MNSTLGYKNPVRVRMGPIERSYVGTAPIDWAATARQAQEKMYDLGIKQTGKQVRGALNDISKGYGEAYDVMAGSGIGSQYDQLFNQLLSGEGLNNAIQEFYTAGTTAKEEIGGATDQAINALSTGADAAILTLSNALAEGKAQIDQFEKSHGEKAMFDLGWSAMKDSIDNSVEQIVNYAQQAKGLSPAVVNQMKKQWGDAILNTGAEYARQATQDAVGLQERMLRNKLDLTGQYKKPIATIQNQEGINKAGVYERAGQSKANITMKVPQLANALRESNATTALNTLQGKQSFFGNLAGIKMKGADQATAVRMQPDYLTYNRGFASYFTPKVLSAPTSSKSSKSDLLKQINKRIKNATGNQTTGLSNK